MKKIFFLVLSLTFCQSSKENFVKSNFKKGLPKGIKFKWENTFYTSINKGDFFKVIYNFQRFIKNK